MPQIKLTESALTRLQPPTDRAQEYYWDVVVTGFGVVVGATRKTFVARANVNGKKRRVVVGVAGAVRDDGHTWNVTRARQRAKELLGQMAAGVDPNAAKRPHAGGPTWRDALAIHTSNMRKKKRSPRSIATIETEVPRLLGAWFDRPIVELGGTELEALCQDIIASTTPRAGAVNPPGAALTKRFVAQLSACWNAADKLHDLPGKNPATRVTTHALDPRTERIDDDGFAGWFDTVQALSPVRRDLQLFVLFTGLRSESARTLCWDDVDFEGELLHVRVAKGDKPYTIPLCRTMLELLDKRQDDNAIEFGPYGGDAGWIFPSLSRAKPFRVQPVAEPKEYRVVDGERAKVLPGLHPLRKTFNSVAIEIGIAKEHREALMNHNGQGVNTRHYGFPQSWDHLAACSAQIEAALWSRIRGRARKSTRRRQRRA